MATRTVVSKRKRRRDKGKLKQQYSATVHYYRYYYIYEYLPAALEYLDGEDRDYAKRASESTKEWHLHNANPGYGGEFYRENLNRYSYEYKKHFNSYEEAMTHLIERKLRMLPEQGVLGYWNTYTMIPWKITEQTGQGKKAKVHRVKYLGTR